MTVTNEKRREVARMLREHGLFASLLPLDKYLAWIYDVLNCGRSVTSLTMRLADHIEPEPERTCHMRVLENASGNPKHFLMYVCSECHGAVVHDKYDPIYYCPNCGAKVVEE